MHKSTFNKIQRSLPSMLHSPFDCENCYQAAECMVYHIALENGTKESSGVSDLFQYHTRGLSEVHLEYLKFWSNLIDLESIATGSSQQLMWTTPSYIRECSNDKCLGGLVITSIVSTSVNGKNIISAEDILCRHEAVVTLEKYHGDSLSCIWGLGAVNSFRPAAMKENDSGRDKVSIAIGDRVTVSLEVFHSSGISKKANIDIEDLVGASRSNSFNYRNNHKFVSSPDDWSIDFVEPNIVIGQVFCITETSIGIKVANVPQRLRR